MKIWEVGVLAVIIAGCMASCGVAGAADKPTFAELMAERSELNAKVKELRDELREKGRPYETKLRELRDEFSEKTKPHETRLKVVREAIQKNVEQCLPKGKQSYGEFEWSGHYGGNFISLNAKDKQNKARVWVQVFYHLDMSEQELKHFSKACLGMPAKRFKDKWVWVLVGKVELRFGLHDKELESDKILDEIVGSFDLEALKRL